jgi:hypothetical protein
MDESLTFANGRQAALAGAVAGLAATAPMTAVMLILHRLLPRAQRYPLEPYRITRRLANRLGLHRLAGDREARLAATTAAHFGYGAAAGALFPALRSWLPLPGVLAGAAYGLAVWAGSYLGLVPALGLLSPATRHPKQRNALMIAAHLVWGATVGLLAGPHRDGGPLA